MTDARRLVKLCWTAPDETECMLRLRYYPGFPGRGERGFSLGEPPEPPSVSVEAVTEDTLEKRDRPDLVDVAQADDELVGRVEERISDDDLADDECRWEHQQEMRREDRRNS